MHTVSTLLREIVISFKSLINNDILRRCYEEEMNDSGFGNSLYSLRMYVCMYVCMYVQSMYQRGTATD